MGETIAVEAGFPVGDSHGRNKPCPAAFVPMKSHKCLQYHSLVPRISNPLAECGGSTISAGNCPIWQIRPSSVAPNVGTIRLLAIEYETQDISK